VTTKSFDRPIPPSSTTFQTPIRILNCLLEGADVPFSIDMDASQLSYINVNHLKKKILKETKNLLQDVDAHQLVLWRIDIADEEGIENYSPKHYISDGIRKLRASLEKIVDIFANPALDRIHVFIEWPSGKWFMAV